MGFVSVVRSELLVSSWPSHRGTRMRPPCVPGGSRYRQLICQPFLSRRVMKECGKPESDHSGRARPLALETAVPWQSRPPLFSFYP